MTKLNLFIILLGGRDTDDKIEAHNLFIGIAHEIESLLPKIKKSWPAATHVDGYMILNHVNGYDIVVREGTANDIEYPKLLIANIGYYKKGEFAEFHKLIPLVLTPEDKIKDMLKSDPDFLTGQALAEISRSHLDDKQYIKTFDVDDVVDVQENVPGYFIELVPSSISIENPLELGYSFIQLKTMKVI